MAFVTVTLTRFQAPFSNLPTKFVVGNHYDGTSSRTSVGEYILPEGCHIGTNAFGESVIIDPQGTMHGAMFTPAEDIHEHKSGHPQLVATPDYMPVLRPF